MIIDFTIDNFRSIKTEQTLSLYVEQPKQHLAEHVSFPANDKIGALKSIGIYGANASGKSNILLAFKALQYMACDSGDLKDGAAIPCYEPYRLSDASKIAPIRFEIEFVNRDDGIRYLYAISFNQTKILSESLDFYPSKQKANIFKRTEIDTWETITFGGLYKGGIKRIPFFENNSYLSKAGESAGAPTLIRSVYKYLRHHLISIGRAEEIPFHRPIADIFLVKVAKLLSHVDTGISDIESKINENAQKEFFFSHKTDAGDVELFEEQFESEGTQKLFLILPFLINAFRDGNTLLIDELDRSLHPHIAELIIRLFNDPEINTNNAQLIFSTHNMQLMSSDKLRRDQIWFSTKTNGATAFYSLDEFDKAKVKSDSPFNTWYNEGRFGALPNIDYSAIAKLLTRPFFQATNSDGRSP